MAVFLQNSQVGVFSTSIVFEKIKKTCAFYFLITCKVNKHLFISSIRLTSNDALLCISYSTNNNRNSGLRIKPEFTCIVLNFFNMVNHSKITTR